MLYFYCVIILFLNKIHLMFKKGSKLYSIFKFKCPHCHEGDFFKGKPYQFKTMGEVNSNCNCCGRKLEIEPGFFQGSYYVTYALGVALFVAVLIVNYLIFKSINPKNLLFSFGGLILLIAPLFYALSKVIWANIFVKYKGQ